MNVLEDAFRKLEEKKLTFDYKKTDFVLMSDVKEIMQDLEIAVRNECDCDRTKEEVINRY